MARLTESTLAGIYRETVDELYRFVSRRASGDRVLAQDVVQETYLRAVESWSSRGAPDAPVAWLKTVARRLLVTHYRRTRPQTMAARDLDGALGDNGFAEDATAPLMGWGLARLRPGDARLLEAFHIDERTLKQIAAETGATERAVEGRLYRARRRLRTILEPHLENED